MHSQTLTLTFRTLQSKFGTATATGGSNQKHTPPPFPCTCYLV
jgi:hypothetical protein